MIPPEKEPKLRVVDDLDPSTEEVVRLQRGEGSEPLMEVVEVLSREPRAVPEEVTERLNAATLESFEGRSMEPGLEALVDEHLVPQHPEESWGEPVAKGVPMGWVILAGVVVAAAISWSLWKTVRGGEKIQAEEKLVEVRIEEEKRDTEEATAMVNQVEETLRGYFRAETVEELLPWVRHAERVKPLMEDWMKRHPWKPKEYGGMLMFQPTVLEGRPFWVLRVRFKDEAEEPVNLLMEHLETGRAKVDWETQVRYQPMEWDEFCEALPTERSMDFRVQAMPDHFFSFEFADASQWSCYRLTAYGAEDYCFGYVKRGSEIDVKMQAMLEDSLQEEITPMLRLRVPVGVKAKRAVMIEAFLAPRWTILGDSEALKDSP